MTVAPSPKSDIGDVFREQLEKLAENARKNAEALRLTGDRVWCLPERKGWNGDLFDLLGMAKPFDRSQNHEDYLKAVTEDPPGCVGELAAAQFQGDWLAAMERAFRQRHASAVRGRLHSAGRLYGHGHELGPLRQGVLKWLEGIIKNTKQVDA